MYGADAGANVLVEGTWHTLDSGLAIAATLAKISAVGKGVVSVMNSHDWV